MSTIPTRSIRTCQSRNAYIASTLDPEMHFECAKGSDQDARCRLLADPPTAPALPERPFFQRLLPADDVPQARARRGSWAAHRLDRPPHRVARAFDAHARLVGGKPRCAPFSRPRRSEEHTSELQSRL